MENKLFKTFASILTGEEDLVLSVRKTGENELTVAVVFNNRSVNDKAKEHLIPFTVSGSPEELDEAFLDEIQKPIEKTKGLLTNMAEYEAAQAAANAKKKEATAGKAAADNAEKTRAAKLKTLTEAGKKAKGEGKWKEAIKSLTEALKLANDKEKDTIQKMLDFCKQKDTPSFDFGDDDQTQEEDTTTTAEQQDEASVNTEEYPENDSSDNENENEENNDNIEENNNEVTLDFGDDD